MGIQKAIGKVVSQVSAKDAYRATVFLSEDLVVKATNPHKYSRRSRGHTCVVTIGKPNYAERCFIRQCKQAGEPLPVRKVQLKRWPKRRAA